MSIEAADLDDIRIRERPVPFVAWAGYAYKSAVNAPDQFDLGIPAESFSGVGEFESVNLELQLRQCPYILISSTSRDVDAGIAPAVVEIAHPANALN